MADLNPLAHRYYLAEVERAARTRERRPLRPAGAPAAPRALAAARRLLLVLGRREAGRA